MLRQILIAGDSTVTNRGYSDDYESGICYTGWGQMLSLFLGVDYRVVNFAKSGLTTDTFRNEGHYDLLIKELKEGDYCLFQFGHNDQKLKELHYNGRYKENLIRYINEIRERKAIPILVTPIARNTWNCVSNEYNDLLVDYANTVREVSIEQNVHLVDLHLFAKNWIIENGRDGVRAYFYPGDYTHTNDYGAYFFAKFVYEQLKDYVKPSEEVFDFKRLCPSRIPNFLRENLNDRLTREEAYKVVSAVGIFFSKSEEVPSGRNPQIICAEQNGYKIFEDRLEEFVTEEDFLKLCKIAICGHDKKAIDVFFKEKDLKNTITREETLEYLEKYEDKMNFAKDRKKHEIAGC